MSAHGKMQGCTGADHAGTKNYDLGFHKLDGRSRPISHQKDGLDFNHHTVRE
ncbi:hypothetical protein CBM2599_B50348 [Cupriavidus taiwanensis]|nr:hypothetical protein CBM2600_B10644 [Cupriavidus taiwanensis]SOY96416.1 hypothetical protein CBM2599_B50348 [Cupriavidus taiwanensis]